jgi:hypothetical protein
MEYNPASLLDEEYGTPVALFTAVTLAPAITAPVGSVTPPRITPVFVCANAQIPSNTNA